MDPNHEEEQKKWKAEMEHHQQQLLQQQEQQQHPGHAELDPPSFQVSQEAYNRGFQERQSPGLQVVEHSNLEVVAPRQGLSHNRTWENTSALPETAYQYPSQQQAYPHAYPASYPYSASTTEYPTPTTAYDASRSPTDYQYSNQGSPIPAKVVGEPPAPKKPRICGITKQLFWIIIAITVFGLVVAIAVGVGVGVAVNKSSSATPTTSSSSATPSKSVNPNISTFPAATATATATADSAIYCPENNRTLYTPSRDTTRRYLLVCGRDYSSLDGAIDLYLLQDIATFADCLDHCAGEPLCSAVGYGNYNNNMTCWLKQSIAQPNWSQGWFAAVEIDNRTQPSRTMDGPAITSTPATKL